MKDFQHKKEYLCGIGSFGTKKIDKYEVGTYDERGYFTFSNGPYERSRLYYRELKGNGIVVLKARIIK